MSKPKKVLLTGATGFIGAHLYPKLIDEGYEVVCATRRPDEASRTHPDQTWVEFDVERPGTMTPALAGCDYVFYLIHQMGGGEGYRERERDSSQLFLEAAETAGVERIVYLGGVEPEGEPSEHLASRLETGEILRSGTVTTIELRAAMIIGAESASWQIVRDLAARLPIMILPKWTQSRSEPIDITDVVEALSAAVSIEVDGSQWFDIPGPTVMTCEEIISGTAELMGNNPKGYPIPLLSPKLSSYWLRFVTKADPHLAQELVQGLKNNLLANSHSYWHKIGHTELTPFKDAARRAIAGGPPRSNLIKFYESLVSAFPGSG